MASITLDVDDPVRGNVTINSLVIDADPPGLADTAHPYPGSGT
jgi:hypothetical protein